MDQVKGGLLKLRGNWQDPKKSLTSRRINQQNLKLLTNKLKKTTQKHYTTQRTATAATAIITIQLIYHWPKHLECHKHKNNGIAKY